jgi:hypothetical protein
MVGYVKQHFFARYRSFESLAHLQQLLDQWLKEEADQRVHGTHREVVALRFEQERLQLELLPATRWDNCYHEVRQVAWDGYVDVRANRYAVPANLCGQSVSLRISLAGQMRIYHQDALVIEYSLRPRAQGWATVPGVHQALWKRLQAEPVEQRPLSVYEEVAACSSTVC